MRDELHSDRTQGGAIARVVRAHPVITSVLLVCTVAGAVTGLFLLTGEWSAARRVAAGAVAGAGIGLLITAPRLIG